MAAVREPSVTVNLISASVLVANTPHKVLLVGQTNGGTVTSGDLVQNIQNDNSQYMSEAKSFNARAQRRKDARKQHASVAEWHERIEFDHSFCIGSWICFCIGRRNEVEIRIHQCG